MDIRGWVYVLSNRAMDGLLKIGFSTKDPLMRAKELSGTALPYPFVVEYDVLVISPKTIEKAVHSLLADKREAKEFFRLSVQEAVTAIHETLEKHGQVISVETLPESDAESISIGSCDSSENASLNLLKTTSAPVTSDTACSGLEKNANSIWGSNWTMCEQCGTAYSTKHRNYCPYCTR